MGVCWGVYSAGGGVIAHSYQASEAILFVVVTMFQN